MLDLPKPKLIIFDLDGTLVDTETPHNQVFVDMLNEHGIPATLDEVYHLVAAKTLAYGYDVMRTHFQWTDFDRAKEQEYMDRFGEEIQKRGDKIAIPNAKETVLACAARLPIAIATNGEIGFSEMKLHACGYFDALPELKLFTKDIVKNPKPAPDLFLYVAEQFGVDPKDTWVIEDSVTGATAGVAAGMTVLGFTGVAHDKEKETQALKDIGAVLVFDDYKNFPVF